MPPTRITTLGKTSRQTATTSRVLSHQYVMIEEIQISSGSGKTLVSKSDSRADLAFDRMARSFFPNSSAGKPKQYSIFSSSAGRNPDHRGGTYSSVEHNLRTLRIFFWTVRFSLAAPRQSISFRT